MNKHRLYEHVKRASKRHDTEFDKYVRMLTSGFTRGKRYSQEEIAEQLRIADEAQAQAQALQDEFDESG